jgi:hypothetical protein
MLKQKKLLVSEKLFVRAAILPSAPLGINFSSLRLIYFNQTVLKTKKASRFRKAFCAGCDPSLGSARDKLLVSPPYLFQSNCSKNKKSLSFPKSFLCGRRDSNSQTSRHQILSLACLPISPRPHYCGCKYTQYLQIAKYIVLFFQ